jgi:chromosome segregation ATPase
MRAHNQFFEQLKQKSRMQQEADILRQNMRVVEDEREQLRNMLAEAEAKSSGEKMQLDELMRGLEVAQETLWNNQQTLTREQEDRMKVENLLGSIRDQKDQDTRNLEQLRGWLDQAQEKLSGAHESLKVTRQNKTDMESRYKEEKEMRSECEDLERQLIEHMEA